MHPLFGPRERVKRANRQIITLHQSFQGFFKDNLYEIGVAEFNPKADNYSLRVKSGPQDFPADWSLLIGEVAHNFRSALDGVVYQLVRANENWPSFNTQFPIFLVGHTKRYRRGNKGPLIPHFEGHELADGRSMIRGVAKPHQAVIEGFQPYKRGNGGRKCPLFLLKELNNTDKHRLLTILTVSPASMEFTGISGGTKFQFGVPLHPNTKVGSVRDVPPPTEGDGGIYVFNPATGKLEHPKMQVNVTVAPGVRFGDSCEAVERFPVITTLQRIASEVSRIIESFAREFA